MNVTTQPAEKPIPADQPLTTEELDALEALVPAIFPGPWRYDPHNKNIWDNALPILDVVYNADELGPFAAAAREAIPRLIAENRQMREAIARLWKLQLHAVDHAWMVANTDLTRALHGSPVLDAIADEAVAHQLPDVLGALADRPGTDEREAEAAR